MARNRKRRVRKHVFLMPVPLAGLMGVMALVGVLFLAVMSRENALNNEISKLERHRDKLKQELSNESSKWARMKSPTSLERALALHRIQMSWPDSGRIVSLSAGGGMPRQTQQYARAERIARHE